jgi:hypothetical protein
MTISGDDNSVIPSTEAIETAQKNITSINGALTNRKDIPSDIKQKMEKYVALMKVKYQSDKDGKYQFKDAVDVSASAKIFDTFKSIFGSIEIKTETNASSSDNAPDDNWLPQKWKDFNNLVKMSAIAGTKLHYDSSRQQGESKKAAAAALAALNDAIANDKDVAIVPPEKKKNSGNNVLKAAAANADNAKDLWIPTILSDVDYGKYNNSNPNKNKFSRAFVSFGYFFEQLILRCATSDVPGISEAQCFFGEFNNGSKAVWKELQSDGYTKTRIMNIAEFPISVAVFLQMYRRKVVEKGSETLTLNDIIDLLSSQIEDPRGEAYGFKYLYTPWSTEKKDSNPFVNDQAKSKGEALQADWKMPQIGYHVEVLSPSSLQASDVDLLDLFEVSAKQSRDMNGNTKRIMRIKIFDKNYQKQTKQTLSTPQRTLQTVTPQEALSIATYLGDVVAPDVIKRTNEAYYNEYAEYVRSLAPKGTALKPSLTDPGKWYLEFESNKAVKDFFSQKIPSIVVGSEGSSVISCTVSSNQNAQITASQIKKSLQGVRPGQPLGASGPSGLPVNIMPVTLSMTTIGCPLFEYGQAFFVDFNTGTSVDNTYSIVDIEHQFSPGKFQTSLRFAYVNAYDGYRNPRTLENSFDLLASIL